MQVIANFEAGNQEKKLAWSFQHLYFFQHTLQGATFWSYKHPKEQSQQ